MRGLRRFPQIVLQMDTDTQLTAEQTVLTREVSFSGSSASVFIGVYLWFNSLNCRIEVQRFEGPVGAKAQALAAPFNAVAEKGQQPDGRLKEVFEGDEPPGRKGTPHPGLLPFGRGEGESSPTLW